MKITGKNRTNIQKRRTKLKKYYERPNELFARFVQGLYLHESQIKEIAPAAYERFNELLNANYYGGLRKLIAILRENEL